MWLSAHLARLSSFWSTQARRSEGGGDGAWCSGVVFQLQNNTLNKKHRFSLCNAQVYISQLGIPWRPLAGRWWTRGTAHFLVGEILWFRRVTSFCHFLLQSLHISWLVCGTLPLSSQGLTRDQINSTFWRKKGAQPHPDDVILRTAEFNYHVFRLAAISCSSLEHYGLMIQGSANSMHVQRSSLSCKFSWYIICI